MRRIVLATVLSLAAVACETAGSEPTGSPVEGSESPAPEPAAEAPAEEASAEPTAAGGCVRAGCAGQLCVREGEELMTTCEERPEYACYRDARCEPQRDGSCDFTRTPELERCLAGR